MGYRSEVAIALTDDAVRLLEAVMEHEPKLKEMVEEAQSTINEFEDDKGGRLYWEHTRWCDSYEEIVAMEAILCTVPDEDYHFIRLGDDINDIEDRGYFDSDMYVQRSISW